jgi:MATE family multidrug resistance protein
VAVGCGWQAFVAYVNVGCYYVVGIPLGCLLGFYFDLGAAVRPLFMAPYCYFTLINI